MKNNNLGFLAAGTILGFVIGISTATLTPMSLKGDVTPAQPTPTAGQSSSTAGERPTMGDPTSVPTEDAAARRTCYTFARAGDCVAVTVPATKTCSEYDPPLFDREDCTHSTPDLPGGNQPPQDPPATVPASRPGAGSASTGPADSAPPTVNRPNAFTIINCWGLYTPQGGINCTTGWSPVVRDDGTTCQSFNPRMYSSTEECSADRPAVAR
jgi:hypothetical protein